jgi:hypothetical protein
VIALHQYSAVCASINKLWQWRFEIYTAKFDFYVTQRKMVKTLQKWIVSSSLFHFLPMTINFYASYKGWEPFFLHLVLLARTRFLYWPTAFGFCKQLPCNLPLYPSLFMNLHISTLKMEAVCSLETLESAFKNVCFHNPKDIMLIMSVIVHVWPSRFWNVYYNSAIYMMYNCLRGELHWDETMTYGNVLIL